MRFCPECGYDLAGSHEVEPESLEVEHVITDEDGETVATPDADDNPSDGEVALAAIEGLVEVATTALVTDTISDLAEEETERVEAEAEVEETEAVMEAIEEVVDSPPEEQAPEEEPHEPEAEPEEEVPSEPEAIEPPAREEDAESDEDRPRRTQSAFARRHRR